MNTGDAGAPSVWISPDWLDHPVYESFYGRKHRSNDFDSPYEMMYSPNQSKAVGLGRCFAQPSMMKMNHGDKTNERKESQYERNSKSFVRVLDIIAKVPERTSDDMGIHTGVLSQKLQACLNEINAKILQEEALKPTFEKDIKAISKSTNIFWGLLCGASHDRSVKLDGLESLYKIILEATHNRAINQLYRHKRHIQGVLHIVHANNVPDFTLNEKELDSFENSNDVLQYDLKYHLLLKQKNWLQNLKTARQEAERSQQSRHYSNSRLDGSSIHIRYQSMQRLLEAVQWYQSMQVSTKELVRQPNGSNLSELLDSPTSKQLENSNPYQKQITSILDILSNQEFDNEYFEFMGHNEWWSIVQAHFENLIFNVSESRTCQLISTLSLDVSNYNCENINIAHTVLQQPPTPTLSSMHDTMMDPYYSSMMQKGWIRHPEPEQVLEYIDKISHRIQKDFEIAQDYASILSLFIQRMMYPRIALLCFNDQKLKDCIQKDAIWRKKQLVLQHLNMEHFNVPNTLASEIKANVSVTTLASLKQVYFADTITAFNAMSSIVPCDLLQEMMHGVVVLHYETAKVLGTTQFSVEIFFPLLAYVLIHCKLPLIHAQLHVLEQFAITHGNINGEESYYVYCVHGAVEYICNYSSNNIK